MQRKLFISLTIFICLYACTQESTIFKEITNILNLEEFDYFNEVQTESITIQILTNKNRDNVLLVAINNNLKVIIDYKHFKTHSAPIDPAFFNKDNIALFVFDDKLYIISDNNPEFRVIDNVYSASVYMDNGYIFTETAGSEIRGKKYSYETLELVEKFKGSGTANIMLKFKYSNGTGYLNEASEDEKKLMEKRFTASLKATKIN